MNKYLNKNWWLYLLDVVLQRPNIANGLLPDIVKEEDRVFDPLLGEENKVLLPSKQWKPYCSAGEEQKRPDSSETFSCVTYSMLNEAEAIMNRMKQMVDNEEADEETQELVKVFNYFEFYNDKGEADLSDGFTAKMSGTTYRGNTYENVCYSMRHDGLVTEKLWPTPEKYTWNEYYKDIPQAIKDRGKQFTNYVDISYERFSDRNEVKIYAPPTVSVYAGSTWNNGQIQQRPSQAHNHSVLNDYDDVNADFLFDSYQPFEKRVAKNYGLGTGRILKFKLKKKLNGFNQNEINALRTRGLKYIMRPLAHGEMYKLTNDGLEYLTEEQARDVGLRTLQERKDFVGISEELYSRLLN